MTTTTVNYNFILSGNAQTDNSLHPSIQLDLFTIQPGDVVSINWWAAITAEYKIANQLPWLYFRNMSPPETFPDTAGIAGMDASNSAFLSKSDDGFTELTHYSGVTTFSPNWEYSTDIVDGNLNASETVGGGWSPGDNFFLNIGIVGDLTSRQTRSPIC